MAAIRSMISVAREEACLLSSEVSTTARTVLVENGGSMVARNAEMEVMNPIGIRQAVEVSVKSASESSILSHHLSHLPPPTAPSQTLESSLLNQIPSSSTISTTARTLERDLGVTIREAISNAGQTGAEEQMDQVVDVARAMSSGHIGAQVSIAAVT